MTDRLTIRLGPLARPLSRWATSRGLSISAAARRIIAAGLDVPEPDMPANGLATLTAAERKKNGREAAKKRWGNSE